MLCYQEPSSGSAFPPQRQGWQRTQAPALTLGPVGSGKLVFLTDIFADLRFLLKSINAFETRLSHFFAHVLHFFPEPLIIKVIQEKIWFIREYFKIVWMAQYMWLLDMGLKKNTKQNTMPFPKDKSGAWSGYNLCHSEISQ